METPAKALQEVEGEMRELADEYRRTVKRCRLALYLKRAKGKGRPRGLYWGAVFRVLTSRGIERWRAHLPGRFTGGTVYRVALRYSEREVFFGFDGRRLVLNRRHARLARALDRMRQSLLRCRVPPQRGSMGTPPGVGLCVRLQDEPALIQAAWRIASACAAVETGMVRFVDEIRPSLPTERLFPYALPQASYITLGWALPELIVRGGTLRKGRRHVANRLSTEVLRGLRIPRPFWPALRRIDWRMRALRREHARYARVIGKTAWLAARL